MSKRTKVLGGILAALVLATGGLYLNGYFDTWAGQAQALEAELKANMVGKVPPELQPAADAYAKCMAEKVTEAAHAAGCSLDSKKPLVPQVGECTQTVPELGMIVQITNMICQVEASQHVPAEPGSQP